MTTAFTFAPNSKLPELEFVERTLVLEEDDLAVALPAGLQAETE